MATTPVWITAYGGPYPGATPMYRSSDPAATPLQIVGYGVPPSGGVPSGVTPIWVCTPVASGAVAANVAMVGGTWSAAAPSSTWSAADASATGMTLSNGGMTVNSTISSWESMRVTSSKSSGKLYIEIKALTAATASTMFGFANSTFNVANYLGSSTYSCGIQPGVNNYCSAGFTSNYNLASTITAGDVVGIAIDFSVGSIWLADSNVWVGTGNPATGANPIISFVPATVGALFAAMSLQGASGGTFTLQPTAASQKYAPPSGFSSWG